jgi:hypothetical protein
MPNGTDFELLGLFLWFRCIRQAQSREAKVFKNIYIYYLKPGLREEAAYIISVLLRAQLFQLSGLSSYLLMPIAFDVKSAERLQRGAASRGITLAPVTPN